MKFQTLGVAAFILASGFFGCRQEAVDIMIVLPNNLRGEFILREGSGTSEINTSSDRILITLLGNDPFEVSDLSMFTRWYRLTAVFSDGTRVPNANSAPNAQPDDLVIQVLGLSSDRKLRLQIVEFREIM